jgi:chemotaxis protein MotB
MACLASLLALAIGCAADSQGELQQRVQQLEAERDTLRGQLEGERAKSAALAERIATESHDWELTRAELAALRKRVDSAEGSSAEYRRLIEQRARRPLVRPELPVSPLPATVDEALQAFAQRQAGRVWYDRGRGALSFANDRLFDTGSDRVRADAEATLGELAGIAALTGADEFEIIIVGHTDDAPISSPETLRNHPSNWHLSVHRAIAVKNVLVSAGLAESRVGVMGYGSFRPVGADKARNRRVEVFFARRGQVRPLAPVRATPMPPGGLDR